MTKTKASQPLPERPNNARIAVMTFPNDPDLKPRTVVVWEFHPTKH